MDFGIAKLSASQRKISISNSFPHLNNQFKKSDSGGRPCGRVVKFANSTAAAQGFTGSDPGRRHGTARQATLRQRPTSHNQKDAQPRYTTVYRGGLGRQSRKEEKKDWQQLLAQVPIFKKKKKRKETTRKDHRLMQEKRD